MGKNIAKANTTFLFCDGGSCRKAKSEANIREARAYLRNEGLWDTTHTIKTRCNGRCEDAPTMIVQSGNYWYKNLTPEKAVEIVKSHTETGKAVEPYLLYQEGKKEMNSSNEIIPMPMEFRQKNDAEFGDVLAVRAPTSDQFLYPLFKKLFEDKTYIKLTLPNKIPFIISEPLSVIYKDVFDIIVKGEKEELRLAIGPIAKAVEKDVPQEIKDRKVSVVEVIWDRESEEFVGHLRLRNKKGKFLAMFSIPSNKESLWEHIFKIYLGLDYAELSRTLFQKDGTS